MEFTWDPKKAASNLADHGVSFEEASTVFEDEHVKFFADEAHSDAELREIAIGISTKTRALFVVYTVRSREDSEVVHIISARKTTAKEERLYADY